MNSGQATVVFDGECGMCRRSIDWLRRADRESRFEYLPYQDPAVSRRFPTISSERFEEAMQLIAPDGRVWEGAQAVEEIMRRLPGWRFGAWLFRIPGVRAVARRIYAYVARNRGNLGCGDHCEIDGS